MKKITRTNLLTNKTIAKKLFVLFFAFLTISVQSIFANGAIGYKGIFINNKGTSTWYKAHVVSWGYNGCGAYQFNGASDFNGVNLGSFSTTDVLQIAGFAVAGWTDSGDWVAGALNFKVWKQGDTEPAYTQITVGNYGNCNGVTQDVCSSGNDRIVGYNSGSTNINPASAGTYNFKIQGLGRMQYNCGNFNTNDGTEVTATFSVSANAPTISAVTSSLPTSSTTQTFKGATITVAGTNLDFVTTTKLGGLGGTTIASLLSQTSTQITFVVPDATSNGTIYVTDGLNTSTSVASITNLGYISTATGNWDASTTGTWLGGSIPTSGSAVTIASPNSVTLAATATVSSLVINSGGTFNNGTSQTINIAAAGSFTNNGTFTYGTGTVNFVGAATVNGTTATTLKNLTLNSGTLTLNTVPTIDGVFTINNGAISAAPIYTSNSTLYYNVDYNRYNEWNATGIGTIGTTPGYPNNVTVNAGTLTALNNDAGTARAMAGNLVVNTGATFTTGALNAVVTVGGNLTTNGTGTVTMSSTNANLNVVGNISNAGSILLSTATGRLKATNLTNTGTVTLSSNSGGDLELTGNLIDNSAFNANTRAVFFTGTGTQTITGTGTFNIDYIVSNKASGSIQMLCDLLCEGPNGGHAITLTNSTDILDLNGHTLTLGKSAVASDVTGSGFIKGSSTSTISILGTGAMGTINFETGSQALNNLTVNRTAGTATIGSDLVISNTLQLTAGSVTSSGSKLTLLEGSKATTESGTSLTVVDLVFSKGTTTTSQFENKGGTVIVSGKILVKVNFANSDNWHFVSFPFAISAIKKADGISTAVYNNDYGAVYYDAAKRATGVSGWTSTAGVMPAAGTGIAYWSTADLYFETAATPSVSSFSTTTTKALTYPSGSTASNNGWNFFAHPLTANANGKLADLGEFRYGYNYLTDTYNVSTSITTSEQQSFDAYFVKTTAARTMNFSTVSMPASIKSSVTTTIDKLTMNLVGTATNYSTLVRVIPQSTIAYDELYDAPYSGGMLPTTPQIYSLIGGLKCAINSVPEQTTVPLGIRVPTTGSYSFTWDAQLTNLPVTLYDNVEKTSTELTAATTYGFTTAVSGEINNRFSIIVAQKITTRLDNGSAENPLYVTNQSGGIRLDGLIGTSNVKLYDTVGKLLLTKVVNTPSITLNVPVAGMYLLELNKKTMKLMVK